MSDFTFLDARGLDTAEAYRLVIGCVVPRPIAWITTVDGKGCVNAAPFSSYNYVATSPPMLAVNIASREGAIKDTARNIRETGEFVVNVATEHTMEAMHACGEKLSTGHQRKPMRWGIGPAAGPAGPPTAHRLDAGANGVQAGPGRGAWPRGQHAFYR